MAHHLGPAGPDVRRHRFVTNEDRSQGWAAGQIISAPRDVNRLFSALLAGRLLPAAQLKQMRTTVPAPAPGNRVRYGLDLTSTPLTCGGVTWGHGGDFPGYHAGDAVTTDGRAATIAVTELPGGPAWLQHLTADTAPRRCPSPMNLAIGGGPERPAPYRRAGD
ncbi:hypothetical protein Airi02_090860 [Actinoallomurus iriomotensis]|uniref:Beta-lactamase-related domain-containing protein n=1 Tax=Actinoallomurus iriomotensis TaxID=478107 RepID=A0A9W6SE96_9ACTN|nr:hypothetical protein Airi02_090860 [Actinoallomurus iriomotensis]